MNRIFALFVLFAIAMQAIPTTAQAVGDAVSDACSIDGYLSTSIINPPFENIPVGLTSIPVEIRVSNDSQMYTYAGVSVGVGLYAAGAEVPSYWAPVTDGLQFNPAQPQDFTVELDIQHVEAGSYELRAAAVQGGQFQSLARSAFEPAVTINKTDVAAISYPFTLTQQNGELIPGNYLDYTLTSENTERSILKDYDQSVVFTSGAQAFGPAVMQQTDKEVRMAFEDTTVLDTSLFLDDGVYTVFGFSSKDQVLLPVVTDTFVVGTGETEIVPFIPAVGIAGLNADAKEVTVTACAMAMNESNQFDGSVVDIEHTVTEGDVLLANGYLDISAGSEVQLSVPKSAEVYTVTTNMYGSVDGISIEEGLAEVSGPEGLLLQQITQQVICDEECQPLGVADTIESFVGEEVVQKSIWFYIGIILAAALLMFFMIGRLTTKEEEVHPGIDSTS